MAVSPKKRSTLMAAAAAPDLISNQPDQVLETIVSHLPTKDGCRTQALSRRWRPVWRFAPLNLDASRGLDGLPGQTISAILSGHLGPVRRISITDIVPIHGREIVHETGDARLGGWLSSRDALDSVQVLDLGYRFSWPGHDVLPPTVFRHAPALRVATLSRCSLPAANNLAVDFPSLATLTLHKVTLTEKTLPAVLAGCSALRTLLLDETLGCDRLRITSPSLRSIGFSAPWDKLRLDSSNDNVQELLIEDAPRLERLLPLNPDDGPAIIRLLQAPKLEILGCVSKGISQLHLGTTVFQGMIPARLAATMPTVKVLALDQVGPDLDTVLDLLKSFPCLERLYIVLHPDFYLRLSGNGLYPPPSSITTVRKYTLPNNPIECLKFHLKKVALKNYYGRRLEADLARFFVLNARVLERMEFGIVGDRDKEWRDNHSMQLQLEDGASRDARFEFKKFTLNTFKNVYNRTHDLSTYDPFNASFFDGFVTLWKV